MSPSPSVSNTSHVVRRAWSLWGYLSWDGLPNVVPTLTQCVDVDELVCNEECWTDDGRIVLIAKSRGFKVYKGILAAYSLIFRDMLASSSCETEAINGCPVVHVSDSAEDLRHFLGAILPFAEPMLHRIEGDPNIAAATIFAIAPLAHKYQAENLQRQAVSCIQEYYTTRFDVWESKGLQGNVPFETSSVSVYGISVVNVARLMDTPFVLPLAFYDCFWLGGKVLEGVETRGRLGGALGR